MSDLVWMLAVMGGIVGVGVAGLAMILVLYVVVESLPVLAESIGVCFAAAFRRIFGALWTQKGG